MSAEARKSSLDESALETRDWIESIDAIIDVEGKERCSRILQEIEAHAQKRGVELPSRAFHTSYLNTIPVERQPPYPGNIQLERRIRDLLRWNAMAMVVRANHEESGIGGHISTYASCATLYEVGFNHFFRGKDHECGGDHVYFQGHASPGNYARAYLEARLTEEQLHHFRREVRFRDGLSSYPHPYLMPDFWEFPTVSMGLGPIQAIYRARFIRYLEDRGLRPRTDVKVWAFVGDGECDEPESLGALTLASRERLDNLIFVVNCNLQRLDGPVRGNSKIIQELEVIFRGGGWNVIKVIWGSEWDELFKKDTEGRLARRLEEAVDGDYQKYRVEGGAYTREHLFGVDPKLKEMVKDYSDEKLMKMRMGGHDSVKVYAAYKAATRHRGAPTVILAKTIKGYGLGEAGEGRNVTHQQKKMNREELIHFRDRFHITVSDDEIEKTPFKRPTDDTPEIQYLKERRQALGGFLPERRVSRLQIEMPEEDLFKEFYKGSPQKIATTMAIVRLLSKLLKDKNLGKLIVPIVPDEARTFGMDALFRQCGIYSSVGQKYEPVDRATLLYYREAKDGQLLEEGITEAGSMSSFIAAGTAYSAHRIPTLPFFFFYSMFGFQRIGDLIWAAGDSRARGFLIGATSGRTTLAGEGLQHQDGHSQVTAQTIPNIRAYDPAFGYEIACIVREGIRLMTQEQKDLIYYLTVGNEPYPQPAMPKGAEEGILRGMYLFKEGSLKKNRPQVTLLGSGAILNEALKAQDLLEKNFGVSADVWSVTSYQELRREALGIERWNRLHPKEKPRVPYITECLRERSGPVIAASDFMKLVPDSIARFCPSFFHSLGTDGFGRSDSRSDLRDFFEVDSRHIVLTALFCLKNRDKEMENRIDKAMKDWKMDPEKPPPVENEHGRQSTRSSGEGEVSRRYTTPPAKEIRSAGTDAGGEGGTSGSWGGGATVGSEVHRPLDK